MSQPDPPDVFCPHCGYDLRNIPEHRCPECGFGYDHRGIRSISRLDFFHRHYTHKAIVLRASIATAILGVSMIHSFPFPGFGGFLLFFILPVAGVGLLYGLSEDGVEGVLAAIAYRAWMIVPFGFLLLFSLASRGFIGNAVATVIVLRCWLDYSPRPAGMRHLPMSLPSPVRQTLHRDTVAATASLIIASLLALWSWTV